MTACRQPLWNQRRGHGDRVLLLHGLGASAHYWDKVLADPRDRELVAPDLLGFGRSPWPPDAPYDVGCHLDALEPLVSQPTVVVGHSTGAILAAALAVQYPDRVSALVLVGLPAFPDAATARREIGRLGELARMTVDDHPLARLVCEAVCRIRPATAVLAPFLIRDLPPEVAADGARHTWTSYSRTLKAVVVEHRVADDLQRVQVPVTFLHGRHDHTAPLEHVTRLADALHRSGHQVRLEVAEGDHHLPVRNAAVVAAAIGTAPPPPAC